jgi:hypothetical protein
MTSFQSSRDEIISLKSNAAVLEETNRSLIRDLSSQISTFIANQIPVDDIKDKL